MVYAVRLGSGPVYDMQILWYFFFFQAEDGIRDLVRSRGLGDVYKRQLSKEIELQKLEIQLCDKKIADATVKIESKQAVLDCLLYTTDAADERSRVDFGGRRILKKKKKNHIYRCSHI